MSQINTNAILDASGGTTTTVNGYTPTVSNMAGRNRIINGDMRIDQRNAGAAVTGSNVYSVDRLLQVNNVAGCTYSVQQDSSAPQGFTNSLKVTITAAASPVNTTQVSLRQYIEGFNTADLNWGTANAKTVTLSFWVKSSLTGTFGGAISNNAFDRTYAYEYTINSANTWEYKTVTIAGDTTGTWETDNSAGVRVFFGFGATDYSKAAGVWGSAFAIQSTGSVDLCATNGATWQITGVQLEAGSVATPFEHRQYGQELALCQRYYQSTYDYLAGDTPASNVNAGCVDFTPINASDFFNFNYFLRMRTAPSVTTYRKNGGATNQAQRADNSGTYINISTNVITAVGFDVSPTTAQSRNYRFHWVAEAEL